MKAYTVLTQDTSTVLVNQLLTSHVSLKVPIVLGTVLCNLPSDLKSNMNEKALFNIVQK
jgi:hypothetical protein